MKQHINKVATTCYYQLWRLWQIRRCVGPEVTAQLELALVTRHILARLLHFSSSISSSVDGQTTSVCPEHCRLVDFQLKQTWTHYAMPHSTALATSSFQEHLQVLCSDVHPSLKVSTLSDWYHAAYHHQTDMLWFAFSLGHNKLHHAKAPTKFTEYGFAFSGRAACNSRPVELRLFLVSWTSSTNWNFIFSNWLLAFYRLSLLTNFYI